MAQALKSKSMDDLRRDGGGPLSDQVKEKENPPQPTAEEMAAQKEAWIRKMIALGQIYEHVAPPEVHLQAEEKVKENLNRGIGMSGSAVGTRPKVLATTEVKGEEIKPGLPLKSSTFLQKKVTDKSESSEDESSTEESSDRGSYRVSRRPKSRTPKGSLLLTPGDLADLIQKISTGVGKTVPEPPNYDMESGKSFADFRTRFERYCTSQYTGEEDDWVDVLGRFLTGDMKRAYLSIKEGESQYRPMMRELESWHDKKRKTMDLDRKSIVRNLTMNPGESIDQFVIRLEGVARSVYGSRFERVARKRLMEAAPPSFVSLISLQNWQHQRTDGCDLPWADIKELAILDKSSESSTKKKSTRPEKSSLHEVYATQDSQQTRKSSRAVDKWCQTVSPRNQDSRQPIQSEVCPACKRPGHSYQTCRQRLGLCYKCGGTGHFAQSCQSGRSSRGRQRRNSIQEANVVESQPPKPRRRSRSRRRNRSTSRARRTTPVRASMMTQTESGSGWLN